MGVAVSPIWKTNKQGETVRAFEVKSDIRAERDRLRRETARLEKEIGEWAKRNDTWSKLSARDAKALRDLNYTIGEQAQELRLLAMAEAYRTKERDVLLAGGQIETGLADIQNPLGPLLAESQAMAGELADVIVSQDARIAWAVQQHHDVTDAGRCKKCNVGAPCKTVRVLLGDEEIS